MPQNQSTPKLEQAAPHARLLWGGATSMSSLVPRASVPMCVGVPAGEILCLGVGGLERGRHCQLRAPGLAPCSGDGGIKRCSDVPVPHACSHGLAGSQPPLQGQGGLPGLAAPLPAPCQHAACTLPAPCLLGGASPSSPLEVLRLQGLAFLQLGIGGITHCGWTFAVMSVSPQLALERWDLPVSPCPASPSPWPQGCHPCCAGEHNHPPRRDPLSPCPLAAKCPAQCPSLTGGLGAPSRGSRCLPPPAAVPRPAPAPPGCNTNHPGAAGHREPQYRPLLFLGGVLPARGAPNYLRSPGRVRAGGGEGTMVGAWGQSHRSQLKPVPLLFLSLPGAGGGVTVPLHGPWCWRLVTGTAGGAPPLQVGLIFFWSLYNNNY